MRPSLALIATLACAADATAGCGTNSLDAAGVCRGTKFDLGKETKWTHGSDVARDPYAYTRADRTDYEPIVRTIHARVTGLDAPRNVARYYTMRMEGGWTRDEVARDIGARYGRRGGEVVVGPLEAEIDAAGDTPSQRKPNEPAPGHER